MEGKNVLFIGGLGAIGLETSKILMAKSLKHLIILDQEEKADELEQLQAISANTKVHFYKFDVTCDKLELQKILNTILKTIDAIDIFIYGAGICNDQLYELAVQVNFAGFVKAVSVIMPHMDKRNGGRGGIIISIASMSGLDPISYLPVYSATKSAIISFTRALAVAIITLFSYHFQEQILTSQNPKMYEQTNIRFVAVCPGGTDTPIHQTVRPFFDLKMVDGTFSEGDKDDNRIQSPEECARNLVSAIENGEAGPIWMLDMGTMKLMVPNYYWDVPNQLKGFMG